jgi:hypothetical protein
MPARYLLLVTPENVYLWDEPNRAADPEPAYVFDATALFRAYAQRLRTEPDHISTQGFELLVANWLNDLLHTSWSPATDQPEPLRTSGFLEAVEGGHVRSEIEP